MCLAVNNKNPNVGPKQKSQSEPCAKIQKRARSQNNRSEPDAKIQKLARSKKSQSEPDAQIQKRSNDNRSQKIQKRSEGLKNRDPSYSGTSKEYRKPPKWFLWPCSFQNASKPGTIRKTPADSTASVQCFCGRKKHIEHPWMPRARC